MRMVNSLRSSLCADYFSFPQPHPPPPGLFSSDRRTARTGPRFFLPRRFFWPPPFWTVLLSGVPPHYMVISQRRLLQTFLPYFSLCSFFQAFSLLALLGRGRPSPYYNSLAVELSAYFSIVRSLRASLRPSPCFFMFARR